jgi:competence protein ComEC
MPRAGWFAAGVVAAAAAAQVGDAVAGSPTAGRLASAVLGIVIVAFATTTAFTSRRPRFGAPFVVGAGAAALALRLAFGEAPLATTVEPETGSWSASVVSVASARDGAVPATLTLERPTGPLEVFVSLPPYPLVGAGDRVRVAGDLRPPSTPGGPARLFARSVDPVGGASPIEQLRRGVGDAIARVLPAPNAGLASGRIVGLRERVDRGLAADFTTAGASHIVAISGWNVALVLATIAPLVARLRRGPRALVLLGAIAGFVLFAGGSASVVRAGAMAGIVLVARAVGRAGAAPVALAWAISALVLAEPAEVVDPGLQLSAAATVGLLVLGAQTTAALRAHLPRGVPGAVVETLGLSLAAEAATLPFVLADFGRLSIVSPAANLLVAPFVAPAMATAALAAVGGGLAAIGLPSLIGVVLALPAWAVLGTLIAIVRMTAAVPFASVLLPSGTGPLAGLVAASALVSLLVRSRRRPEPRSQDHLARSPRDSLRIRLPSGRALTLIGVASLLAAMLLVNVAGAAASRPDGVRVTALDVGQGDAILVESDRGSRMLVDGGPDPGRLLNALDGRLPPWDRRIDVLVLTHPHEDHAAGLPALIERYQVSRVFEPGMRGPGPGYRAFEADLAARGVRAGRLSTGDRLALDDLGLRVLWPDRDSVPDTPGDDGTSINNVSIVLLGTFGRQRLLLAGDIEEGIDPLLIKRHPPHVDLLKVAHHGSATASTDGLLSLLHPEVALVSVGARNPYGHPARSTLDRLRAHGAEVYRTDRNGNVAVDLDGVGLVVSRQRGEADGEVTAAAASPADRGSPAVPLLACQVGRPAASSTDPGGAGAAGEGSVTGPDGYDRTDARSRPDHGRLAPAVARATGVVPATCPSRGGGRLVAGARRGRARGLRSAGGRGSGPAPRRRQASPGARSRARAAPRRGLGGLVEPTGVPGARPARRGPPGDVPARGGVGRVAGDGEPRGGHRGLCGQAGRSATRADGGALRGLGAPLRGRRLDGTRARACLGACAGARGTCL